MTFNEAQNQAQELIENVAYSLATKTFQRRGQADADRVYNSTIRTGQNMWHFFLSKNSAFEALNLLDKYLAHRNGKTRSQAPKPAKKQRLQPGPELFCLAKRFAFEEIVEKYHDATSSNKCESKKQIALKNAKEKAYIFVANAWDIYKPERHGQFLPLNEYENMIAKCKQILAA